MSELETVDIWRLGRGLKDFYGSARDQGHVISGIAVRFCINYYKYYDKGREGPPARR
jgi:hypothetical protein